MAYSVGQFIKGYRRHLKTAKFTVCDMISDLPLFNYKRHIRILDIMPASNILTSFESRQFQSYVHSKNIHQMILAYVNTVQKYVQIKVLYNSKVLKPLR